MTVKVLVPGTFDPITCGHVEVIERASRLFDQVVVGVAASRNKKGVGTLFTLEERVDLACKAVAGLNNVEVMPFECLLVDFAREIGATALVKGLRATTDFEYEFQQAGLNYRLAPELETIFVTASPDYTYISSSIVKEISSFGGDLKGMVPACVEQALKEKIGGSTKAHAE